MSSKTISVIYSSPRKNGNSDRLAKEFVRGAIESKNMVNEIYIRDLQINGCIGCEYCYEHNGKCAQNDDMQKIYNILEKTDVLVFATPIYYQFFPSQLKVFVDRLYVTENRKFGVKESVLLATYASRDEKMSEFTIKYFEILSEYHGWKNAGIIAVSGLDEKTDIINNEILIKAYELGKNI